MNKRRFINYSVFYLIWVLMVLFETYAWAILGFVMGYVIFAAGGYALAIFHMNRTDPGEKPFGPPLRIAQFITRRYRNSGLVINALLNGGQGVAIVERALQYDATTVRIRAAYASILYATTWLAIHWFRPPSYVPISTWPSWEAISVLLDIFS